MCLESTKSRGLHGNVVCVGLWVHGLYGSNFYVGCMGQIFLHRSNFCVCGSLRGSKSFTWVENFCVGQFSFAMVNLYLLDEIILLYYN